MAEKFGLAEAYRTRSGKLKISYMMAPTDRNPKDREAGGTRQLIKKLLARMLGKKYIDSAKIGYTSRFVRVSLAQGPC